MRINFPITSKNISKQIEGIISEIQKETGLQLETNLSGLVLTFGSAPEFGSTFGVKREKNNLIFGNWLNHIKPEYVKQILWTFVIIRESLYFFLKKELFNAKISALTDIFLNFIAISYMNQLYASQSFDTEIYNIKSRFLYDLKWYPFYDTESFALFDTIINLIISQNISMNLILNTYYFFINNLYPEDSDFTKILVDFKDYIDVKPLEKAAPIQLTDLSTKLIQEIIKAGSEIRLSNLAQQLDIDTSIFHKEVHRLVRKYNVTWRLEKNWNRLGLHAYLILIRFTKVNFENNFDVVLSMLSKNHYIFELFKGENNDFNYIYTASHFPHISIDSVNFQLEKFVKEKKIHSFEIKPILERNFFITITKTPFDCTLKSFNSLLEGLIDVEKIELWSSQKHLKSEPYVFSKNEKKLLQIISIIISKSLISPRLFTYIPEQMNEFLKEHNFDFKKVDDILNFINNLLTEALQKNLIVFRLTFTFSKLIEDNLLVLRVKSNPESEESLELINTLTSFGWTIILKSYEEFFVIILGILYTDVLTKLITEKIEEKTNNSYELLSIKTLKVKSIPYYELFDFSSKKWLH